MKRVRLTTEELEHVVRNAPRLIGIPDTAQTAIEVRRAASKWADGESPCSALERLTFRVCEEIRSRRRSGRDLIQPGEVID